METALDAKSLALRGLSSLYELHDKLTWLYSVVGYHIGL